VPLCAGILVEELKGVSEFSMEKGIVILDANKKSCRNLCAILDENHYGAIPAYSLNNILPLIDNNACKMLILDMDTIDVDKSLFRKLKKTKPSLNIVGISSRSFHPELEEAMSQHIYACLSKPLDEDELVFWVNSLF
jgi:DNA-binding NtrC family response regulator